MLLFTTQAYIMCSRTPQMTFLPVQGETTETYLLTMLIICLDALLDTVMQAQLINCNDQVHLPSMLWRCWLGGRKGIWQVKNWVVKCWCGYLSGASCRFASGPADATATVSCFSRIQIGSTFLVPAHPGRRDVKWMCVYQVLNWLRQHTKNRK